MSELDVVIVGGGAAGLSAALVLVRARRRVAVVDAGRPRNAAAARMRGYLGADGWAPAALLSAGREEVTGYGGEVLSGADTGVARGLGASGRRPQVDVRLEDGRALSARRILVATGLRDQLPDVPGARERWGRDVLHCPYCHGHEVRDRPLGVLGGTPEALMHVQLVRQWSADLIYFAHGAEVSAAQREQLAARAIDVVDEPVSRLVIEDDRLVGVELATGRLVPRTAVFVRPRFVATDDLLDGLGAVRGDTGWVTTDATGRTSVTGVWAAGNVANPRAQMITAAGEGSAAAIAINNDLTEEDVADAVAAWRLGVPA